jgi:hypothetical protein
MSDREPQEAIDAVDGVAELDPASKVASRIQPPDRYDDLPQVRVRRPNAAAIFRDASGYLDQSPFSPIWSEPIRSSSIVMREQSARCSFGRLFIEIETAAFAPPA